MKKLKMMLVAGLIVIMSLAFVTDEAFARGGSRGGGRSSFSSSKSSSQSSNKSSWGSKSKNETTRAQTKAITPKRTPAQQKSFEQAKKNGTVYKSKSEAQNAFKQKYADKYPSKYVKEPTIRPSHIPQTTKVGGNTYNVTYNSGMGGYGYTNSLGAFIMYDMMSDAIMMNAMMAQNNYIVDASMSHAPVVIHRTSGINILFWILGIVGIIFLFILIKTD